MTDTPARIIALPMDTLDRTAARFRIQPDDYKAATELTLARSEWEDLGMPSVVYARLSATPPEAFHPLTVPEGGTLEGPHSRACGIRSHPHGGQCAVDCPTCARADALGNEPGGAL